MQNFGIRWIPWIRIILTTNQEVAGSIPASRTKIKKPATIVAGFFILRSRFFMFAFIVLSGDPGMLSGEC